MTPELLHTALEHASATVRAAHGIAPAATPRFHVCRPRTNDRGDWSSNLALRSVGSTTQSPWESAAPGSTESITADPRAFAAEIAMIISEDPEVAHAEAAGPGFINITLTTAGRSRTAADLAELGEGYLPGHTMSTTAGEVRRLQLAHAAAQRAHRRALAAGIDAADFDADALGNPAEVELLNALAQARNGLSRAVDTADHHAFLDRLAAVVEAFEHWIAVCVVTPTIDVEISRVHASRLVLVRAAITVLAAGLRQLGASAPERM